MFIEWFKVVYHKIRQIFNKINITTMFMKTAKKINKEGNYESYAINRI